MCHASLSVLEDSHNVIGMNFGKSPATVSKIVKETCFASCNASISKDYLKALSLEEEWILLTTDFKK